MKKEEISNLMKKVEVLRDALGNSAGYAKPVWKGLILIGMSVIIAYLLEQVAVWTNKFNLQFLVWIGFAIAIISISFSIFYSYAKSSNKDEALKGKIFFSTIIYITLFALFIASFIIVLPSKVNPFIENKQWYVWFITYSFMLFSYGVFFSLKHFTISAFAVLLGIPISMAFPHYEILFGGLFLGLGLIIPSLIEYRRN